MRCRSDAEGRELVSRSDGRVIDRGHTLSVQVVDSDGGGGGSGRFAEIWASGVVDEGVLGGLRLFELDGFGLDVAGVG